MVAVLAGLSMLFVRGSYKLVAQAQSEEIFLDRGRSPQALIEAQQTLTGDLEAEDVAAVALTARTDDLTGAAVLTGQDLLVDANCVSNPGTAWVNISPSAFRQAETSPANGFRFWPEGGYLYSTASVTTYLVAPLYLPNAVTLTHMAMVFFDNAPTNVTAFLLRKNLASPSVPREQIAGFFSSTSSPTQVLCASRRITHTTSTNYGYFVALELPPNPGLDLDQLEFGLRIYYEPPPTSPDVVIEAISMAAFRHNGNNADNSLLQFASFGPPSAFIRSTGSVSPCLMAPVNLPDGAVLTEFRASVRDIDSNPNQDLTVQLRRSKPDTGDVDTIAQITTVGFSPITDNEGATTFTENVSNVYNYYVTFCLPPNPTNTTDILFYGTRLFYTPP